MTALTNEARRDRGAYYTPDDVADWIARRVVPAAGPAPRVIDPSCGDGQFLLAAWRILRRRLPPRATLEQRCELAAGCLFGMDLDESAVAAARTRLLAEITGAHAMARPESGLLRERLESQLRCQDGLLADPPGDGAPFDVVLTNPPFLNSRRQTKQLDADVRRQHRMHFQSARGAYDLFVLFLERAWQLLAPGGRCGAIVPNKLAVLDYAEPCRRLLTEQAELMWIADASRTRLFTAAGVYPLLLGFRRQSLTGTPVEVVLIRSRDQLGDPQPPSRMVSQGQFKAAPWRLHGELDVESRLATVPLGELADWHAGTAGFAATETAGLLREADELPEDEQAGGRWAEFVVSGSIRPYRLSNGSVRFMKRRWRRPLLDLDSPALSARRQRMYTQQKILVAGMSRGLAAAWDGRGRALGVQAYAATDLRADRLYLLALLNSSLLACLFQLRFSGKRLAGGYFSINKSQLVQLPVPAPDTSCPRQQALIDLAARRENCEAADADRLDQQIDRLVLELYGVERRELEEAAV